MYTSCIVQKVVTSYTVCPGSSDPFYIVSYIIKWVTTSWTFGIVDYYLKCMGHSYWTHSSIKSLDGSKAFKIFAISFLDMDIY